MDSYVTPNRENIQESLPNVHYNFWDFNKIKKRLIQDGATDVLDAINNIKPYALKADIARYYLVYKTGGWYIDLNNYFNCVVPEIIRRERELIVFGEVQQTSDSTWAINNGLFYAEPEHPALKQTIDLCIENVKNKYYGFNALCPTGPNVLGRAVASQKLDRFHRQLYGRYIWHVTTSPRGFYFKDRPSPFALYKPNGEMPGESSLPGGNSYIKMWNSGNLY